MNQAICRFCRTKICDECNFSKHSDHLHACLPCTRLRLQFSELRISLRECSPSRLPPRLGMSRADSLPKMVRDSNRRINRASTGNLASDQAQKLAIAEHQTPEMGLKRDENSWPAAYFRRRRHTSAITPTVLSNDFRRLPTESRARQHLKVKAPNLQIDGLQDTAKQITAVNLNHLTKKTPEMTTRCTTSIKPTEATLHLQTESKLDSSDLTEKLRQSNRESSHKRKLTVSKLTKWTQCAKKTNTAPMRTRPIRGENLAEIDSNFLDNQVLPDKPSNLSTAVLRRRSKSAGKPVRNTSKPIINVTEDRLSRQSQQASTIAVTRKVEIDRLEKLSVQAAEMEAQSDGPMDSIQSKSNAQLIDFHLSKFDLKPARQTVLTSAEEQATPNYLKDELCDLSYLEKFRSFTL
ncbi:uncharacterized protein PHALS_10383 [Plasmopara halstedii]|uniref:Uncharacterized protein n=1 Tax=Plasmopara halstedii TaxID=4781 RepID=A0A0N7L510_PLAHL|nr:uncharacterized protein PHALS_10383 [Plasmopara halstedii]CEG40171.1 hypothetical protein PHALS_10383 [Plasmopara halstedii]|eukprot:XP_024576540.1 hypothetical protein PHALS_10383 [Plasmopara halstedii]